MWKASVILILITLSVTRLTKADYYEYNRDQYKQSVTRFKCTEEGYHADPHDCRVYYRCVDWGNGNPLTTFRFECGVGTVFSKNKGDICTYPGDSGRLECAGSENELDSNLNNPPENPSPIWTTTVRTTMRPQQTTTQFSITTRQPTITMQVATTTRKPVTAQSSLTSRPTTGQPENNCKNKLQCTQEEFLADTCDCRKFYRCVNEGYGKFRKYDFICGSGTIWDPEIQGCNHAWAVTKGNCRQSLESENNINNNEQWYGGMGDGEQWNGNIDNADQSDQLEQTENYNNQLGQSEQPEQLGSSGMPDYSESFSITDLPEIPGAPTSSSFPGYPGIPASSSIPDGSDFSGYSEIPSTSGSSSSFETPETSSFPDSSSSSSYPETLSSPDTPCSSETSETLGSSPSSLDHQPSPDLCTKEGFFADPNDCRKFYRCVNNGASFTKYEFQCGVGTIWDSSIQSCNHVYAVAHCNHTSDITNKPDTSINELDSTDKLDTSTLPPMQYPESSTISPTSSKPEILSSTHQTESITNKPIISSQTTVSYLPPNSSSYPSTTMQVNESVSYLPPAIQTTTSISYLPPSSTATTDATSGSESISYLPPDTSIDSRPITSTLPSSISSTISSLQTGKFECTEEGFFLNPSNCKKFYRCVQGQSGYQKYEFECSPGTAWDQSIQTCNYIEQVTSCSTKNNEIDQSLPSTTSNPASESLVISSSTTIASSQITTTVPISTTVTNIPETSTESFMPEKDKIETSSTTITSSEKPVSEKPEEIQMPESSSMENLSESSSEQSSSESSEESSLSTESHVPDCATQKLNNTIVCNNEGFYPHPIRCDKFYRCVDNGNGFNVYHFDCPPGTIFDPSISVCNYPESVYPTRDCMTGSTTLSNINTELTTEPETSEQSVSTTTTIQSTTQQTEESTVISSTTMSMETTTLEESSVISNIESTTISESIENMTESTTESITAITEDVIESSTEQTEVSTSTESETESEKSTTESQEFTTKSQEQSTESQEQLTTASSNTEEQSTTESQEQSTIESQEQSTTESQEQSTTELSQSTTKPTAATPCTVGNLTDDQIILVCPTGFRRHPKYCNLFYQCTSEGNMEIKILVLSCPENTIFDEKKIQCLSKDKSSDPCTGDKANLRLYRRLENNALSPIKVSSNQLCPEEGYFPYRQGCSNNFYKCKRDIRDNLQGYFYKCPENFVYWSISRRCERITRLPMCSHLAYRNKTNWNDRWQIPTEDFNLSARMFRI